MTNVATFPIKGLFIHFSFISDWVPTQRTCIIDPMVGGGLPSFIRRQLSNNNCILIGNPERSCKNCGFLLLLFVSFLGVTRNLDIQLAIDFVRPGCGFLGSGYAQSSS